MTASTATARPHHESEVAGMFNKISGRYDLMNHLLSANIDKIWRRQLVEALPKIPAMHLLDVATGTCDVLLEVQKHRPDTAKLVGVDISSGMLNIGKEKVAAAGMSHKTALALQSAERIEFPDNTFHAVTISFGLRNVIDRKQALKEFSRVLKTDGTLAILEFFTPSSTLFAKIFLFYFHHVLPMIGGLLSDRKAYSYLPRSVGSFYSAEELRQVMQEVGYQDIKEKSFLFGACRLVTAKTATR